MLPYELKDVSTEKLKESLLYWIRIEQEKSNDVCELSTKLSYLKDSLKEAGNNITAIEKELSRR